MAAWKRTCTGFKSNATNDYVSRQSLNINSLIPSERFQLSSSKNLRGNNKIVFVGMYYVSLALFKKQNYNISQTNMWRFTTWQNKQTEWPVKTQIYRKHNLIFNRIRQMNYHDLLCKAMNSNIHYINISIY